MKPLATVYVKPKSEAEFEQIHTHLCKGKYDVMPVMSNHIQVYVNTVDKLASTVTEIVQTFPLVNFMVLWIKPKPVIPPPMRSA